MSPTLGVQRARCLSVSLSVCQSVSLSIYMGSLPLAHNAQHSLVGASVSEPHLGSSTRPLSVCQSVSLSVCQSVSLSVCQSVSLSVCLYIYIYISCVRHFWSRGPRATRKRKPAHLKFKGHMHACCILLYVANASRAITTLIERLHMYSSSLITSSAG